MGGGFFHIRNLGALIIWTFKGFKGSYNDCQKHKFAFEIGLGLILLFVLILSLA